jgi:hypothetical protein
VGAEIREVGKTTNPATINELWEMVAQSPLARAERPPPSWRSHYKLPDLALDADNNDDLHDRFSVALLFRIAIMRRFRQPAGVVINELTKRAVVIGLLRRLMTCIVKRGDNWKVKIPCHYGTGIICELTVTPQELFTRKFSLANKIALKALSIDHRYAVYPFVWPTSSSTRVGPGPTSSSTQADSRDSIPSSDVKAIHMNVAENFSRHA